MFRIMKKTTFVGVAVVALAVSFGAVSSFVPASRVASWKPTGFDVDFVGRTDIIFDDSCTSAWG